MMADVIRPSNSNPLRELPPEFDASAREAMRTKARRTKHECMAEMSDEWLANELRMLSRHDLWHEPFCVAARDRIMRLSMQLAEARGVIDALKSRSAETGALREALENISTVRPLEHFPAVTALAYCREKSIEALKATREFQEVIVGEYEADGKINMASSPLPEGTKLYARLPLRHSEKADDVRDTYNKHAAEKGWPPTESEGDPRGV